MTSPWAPPDSDSDAPDPGAAAAAWSPPDDDAPAPANQTHFQQATSPDAPELTLGQTAQGAVSNFVPSVVGAAKAVGHAIAHPGETAGAIGDIGKGAVSQAAGALGVAQDPKEKQNTEALLDALEEHYKAGYGSMKGFKQMLATDPAGVLMDASTLADGAGLVGKAAGLSKFADAAKLVAKNTDPINMAVQAGAAAGKGAMNVVRGAQAGTTGVPKHLLKVISTATSDSAPAGALGAFKHYAGGAGTPAELQTDALNALGSVKDDVSSRYLSGKGSLSTATVPLRPMYDKLDDLDTMLQRGATSGLANAHGKAAAAEIRGYLNDIAWNPTKQTLPEMDAVKQQIYNLHGTFANDKAKPVIDGMYNAVRDTMGTVDPNYINLMDQYSADTRNVNDLVKTLGLGKKSAATQTAIKMMRANKVNTIGGAGRPLIDQLAEHDPLLPYKLAGIAVKDWAPSGLRNQLEGLGPLAMILHPAEALKVGAGMTAMSPKIAGGINRISGRLGDAVPALTSPGVTKPTYFTGRADQEEEAQGGPQPDDTSGLLDSAKSYAGKVGNAVIGRASGGRVDHEALVNRLINRWKAAKKASNDVTKPLLHMHDDAVAKALEIAGKAI